MMFRALPFISFNGLASPKYHHQLCFIQALFLYLPTLFFLGNRYFLIFIGFSLLMFGWRLGRKDGLLLAFATYVVANTAYGVLSGQVTNFNLGWSNGIIGGPLLAAFYLAARTLSIDTLKYLLLFICFEAAIVYIEALQNIRILFYGQLKDFVGWPYPPFRDMAHYFDTPLKCLKGLYELKPFGLSSNSLNIAVKMLVGISIVSVIPLQRKNQFILYGFLAAAMVMVRGRATLLALLVLTCIWIANEIRKGHMDSRLLKSFAAMFLGTYAAVTLILTMCPGISVFDNFQPATVNYLPTTLNVTQLYVPSRYQKDTPYITTHAVEEIEPITGDISKMNLFKQFVVYSGRSRIWIAAAEKIENYPWLGDYSIRLPVYNGQYANNAYLSILCVHGVLGTAILALFYFRRIFENWSRFWLILPFLAVCLTDDTLFWYMSLQDALVYYILTAHKGGLFSVSEDTSAS